MVPAIDLRGGAVVHARRGRREAYAPLRSRLCPGCDPVEVAGALLDLHPFRALYVADLDRIGRRAGNEPALRRLREAFPQVELWVDAGLADAASLAAWRALGLGEPVIGSETLAGAGALAGMAAGGALLSLDFEGERLCGPAGAERGAAAWPGRLIAMALHRVGSGEGPDEGLLARLAALAPGRPLYAAGGVRDGRDLERLAAAGLAGALVASALHEGRLGGGEIAAICAPPA